MTAFDFEEHGIGKRNLVPLADCGKMDEVLRLADGNVAKKQCVDEREDGGIRADSQGERESTATTVNPGFLPRTRMV